MEKILNLMLFQSCMHFLSSLAYQRRYLQWKSMGSSIICFPVFFKTSSWNYMRVGKWWRGRIFILLVDYLFKQLKCVDQNAEKLSVWKFKGGKDVPQVNALQRINLWLFPIEYSFNCIISLPLGLTFTFPQVLFWDLQIHFSFKDLHQTQI